VRDIIAEPVAAQGGETEGRAERLLEQVGLPQPRVRGKEYPHQLSGGMCQRVMVALAIAGLVGVLDIWCFRRVPDTAEHHPARDGDWMKMIVQPLRDTNFRRYLMMNFTFFLSVGYIGQYIWLYLFDVVMLNNWMANLFMIALPRVLHMFTYGMWGRLVDRLGKRPVLILTMAGMTISPLGWAFMEGDSWRLWAGLAVAAVGILSFPGYEISTLNVILDEAGGRRDRARGGSAYVALNAIALALGGILSGLFGAVVAGSLGDWRIAAPVTGTEINYLRLLLLIAVGLRLVALCFAVSLEEPRSRGTRDALRYMTSDLYSNVRQAVLMPARVMTGVRRLSYRLNRKVSRRP